MSDLNEWLDIALKEYGANLRVCLPGKIVKYDADTEIASVQPLIKRQFYREKTARLPPIITQVPVIFPRTATSIIRLPVTLGDIVVILFADRAIDNWVTGNGSAKDPISQRLHHTADAFAFVGGYPIGKQWKATNPDALEIQVKSGTKITIGNGTEELIQLAHDAFSKLKSLADELSGTLTDIQAITVTAPSGGGPTSPPINASAFAAIKTNVDTLSGEINTLVTNLEQIKV